MEPNTQSTHENAIQQQAREFAAEMERTEEKHLWERAALAALQGYSARHGNTDYIDSAAAFAVKSADAFIKVIRGRKK